MKESTGGMLLLGLASAILLIFIIFCAFFINYGKHFRTKNKIVNHIEQQESVSNIDDFIENEDRLNYKGEYDICYNLVYSGSNFIGLTFKVTLVMTLDKTIAGETFNLRIKIPGETRMIESGNVYESIKTSLSDAENIINTGVTKRIVQCS